MQALVTLVVFILSYAVILMAGSVLSGAGVDQFEFLIIGVLAALMTFLLRRPKKVRHSVD